MQRVVVVVMMRLVRNDTCMWWIHLQHEIKQQRERGRACSTVVLVVYIVGTYIHVYTLLSIVLLQENHFLLLLECTCCFHLLNTTLHPPLDPPQVLFHVESYNMTLVDLSLTKRNRTPFCKKKKKKKGRTSRSE